MALCWCGQFDLTSTTSKGDHHARPEERSAKEGCRPAKFEVTGVCPDLEGPAPDRAFFVSVQIRRIVNPIRVQILRIVNLRRHIHRAKPVAAGLIGAAEHRPGLVDTAATAGLQLRTAIKHPVELSSFAALVAPSFSSGKEWQVFSIQHRKHWCIAFVYPKRRGAVF